MAEYINETGYVSILVLLDDSHQAEGSAADRRDGQVSILVLLDDSHQGG